MSAAGLRFHGDRLARAGMLDFAVNVWPVERPAWLQQILHAALDAADRYPDDTAVREAVASRHGRPPDEVLLLDGACEAFWLLPAALGPRHAACVHPAFTEPEAALRAARVRVSRVHRPPEDWRLVPAAVPPDADLVVLGNPNNPTGALDPGATVARLARPGRTVVVDESFIELTEHPAQSLAGRRDLPGLVVVRSLTKLWGLAGLRAGYLLAPPEVVAALRSGASPGASTRSHWRRSPPAARMRSPRPPWAEPSRVPGVTSMLGSPTYRECACGRRARTSCSCILAAASGSFGASPAEASPYAQPIRFPA